MKLIIILLISFTTLSALSSQQVLTCGFVVEDEVSISKCLNGDASDECAYPLPDSKFMSTLFEIWLATDHQDYSMTFYDKGFFRLVDFIFEDFKASAPIVLDGKKMELDFSINLGKENSKTLDKEDEGSGRIFLKLDMENAGKLEGKPGKQYYIGTISDKNNADDSSAFACEYQ